jgi:hypothetical protein
MYPMNLGWALIVAAALIAGAMAVSHRYSLGVHACTGAEAQDACSRGWLADNWTGKIMHCEFRIPAAATSASGVACVEATFYGPHP